VNDVEGGIGSLKKVFGEKIWFVFWSTWGQGGSFGRNLKRWEGTRVFDDVFEGYPAGIGRLDKKIGNREIPHFSKNFLLSIFSPSLPILT
jgi:hypothetical protein